MSAQYTRARSFSPLFRGLPDQQMRVSDAERQAVTDRLAEHFGDGRLDHAEFDDRVGRAMNAKTRADLTGLLDDLPDTGLPDTGAPADQQRSRRRPRSLLGLVLLVVIIVMAAHAAVHAAVLLLWAALLVAIVVAAARGRARHHQ